MSSIEFDVVQKNNKPRSIRFRNDDGTICLFDTGANYPVWCTGLQALYAQYPDSYKVNDAVGLIRGFGGNGTTAVICCIPEFRLSDGKETLLIHNMCVAVCEKDFECDLILSYPLFNLSNVNITTFSRRGGTHRLKPVLRIDPIRKVLYAKNEYALLRGKKVLKTTYCLASAQ